VRSQSTSTIRPRIEGHTHAHTLDPGYRPAFDAWAARHPLTSPNVPPGRSYMSQYRISQQTEGLALTRAATRSATKANQPRERRTSTTCASRSSGPPSFCLSALAAASRSARQRYGLVVATVLLAISTVQNPQPSRTADLTQANRAIPARHVGLNQERRQRLSRCLLNSVTDG